MANSVFCHVSCFYSQLNYYTTGIEEYNTHSFSVNDSPAETVYKQTMLSYTSRFGRNTNSSLKQQNSTDALKKLFKGI